MKTNQKAKVKSIPRCKGKKMTTYHSQPRHCGRHTLDDQNTGKTQGHTCEQCDMAPISVHPYLSLILIKWLDLGKLARFGLKKHSGRPKHCAEAGTHLGQQPYLLLTNLRVVQSVKYRDMWKQFCVYIGRPYILVVCKV